MAADDPVTVLSEDESWSLLGSASLGRFVIVTDGRAEIFPVNFVTQRRTLLFRTAPGTKLYRAIMSDQVAFEADGYTDVEGWSVIVHGRAHLLTATAEVLDAEEAPLRSWPATVKPHYVRLIAMEVSGRRFRFGPEPRQ
ncbi:Nitroimidazol reductase NimA or a related FMN-containing flavoprotein, pyridoxamine 5'-phosphate oxidase superfamily [Mycobacterium rhizamassiliense]|jgi:nitroimidazol reductase NimA-like FMN-containing flavoprotein (pyridoxamine 5'-phosphate oxidase superfamily)|uniref:Nitroimidazol reductase NimA or a related FMN-containing flavoprotein, pyridoxamine 5'-phosphate oxidase superfamily n=1 Tax=Mycobacterium rhizamassiliense TaxID=1841860 RepID=A0A2U3NTC0_9MYCO|nr:pyridoxamine 5'-phosphate oxidase family protein [Mycobacterium rhizamassiliense]SPM34767.1 Nitroimidazol reductase NimA or a related FMN-containing flavoprotein, pyridoxamine 5'-phosphate oxidase superfamily [Mycobacterium rhizamassiliense]